MVAGCVSLDLRGLAGIALNKCEKVFGNRHVVSFSQSEDVILRLTRNLHSDCCFWMGCWFWGSSTHGISLLKRGCFLGMVGVYFKKPNKLAITTKEYYYDIFEFGRP